MVAPGWGCPPPETRAFLPASPVHKNRNSLQALNLPKRFASTESRPPLAASSDLDPSYLQATKEGRLTLIVCLANTNSLVGTEFWEASGRGWGPPGTALRLPGSRDGCEKHPLR